MYNEFGPQWADEHAEELYCRHYDDAVKELTAERLQSYYLRHPDMATTAIGTEDGKKAPGLKFGHQGVRKGDARHECNSACFAEHQASG
jgi:hypothetical protein